MEKIILIDGNNLLFRSYYATAYNGNFMKNSKGFPTNALFGFTNMMNKIILEEKPIYIMVAFDKGKTFRHDMYESYKDGRSETPDELKIQMPVAKELLSAMGIKYYEIDNYEADDIIGTFASFCDREKKYIGTIISSDRDLLQLISDDIDIKLLKQKDYIRYNYTTFLEQYGIEPINVIDLKAIMGDPSDNIPGVKGIGEKGALKLLQEYKTLDSVYKNIDNIKGAMKEKLINDKDNAYLSYELATIVKDINMDVNIEDVKYLGNNHKLLNSLYEELEFYSFLKKDKDITNHKTIDVKIIDDISGIKLDECAVYLEILGNNYHTSRVLGMGVYNKENSFFIPLEGLKKNPDFLMKAIKYTYDYKKVYVALKWNGINIDNVIFDTMIAASLLDYNVKTDIAYLANNYDFNIDFYDNVYKEKNEYLAPQNNIVAYNAIMKAKFIYETYNEIKEKIELEGMLELFNNIEMPLISVLGDIEYNGFNINLTELDNMGEEIKIKLELISKDIYNNAGYEFNISSPKELGEILFDKIGLPHGKKLKTGYSTAIDVLNKLKGKHPIIEQIIEHRMLSKLYTTYIEGLKKSVQEDGKIHTIYTQTLTRTGRLSSIEPNLQNIPVRNEYGRLIRKCFVPSKNSIILSCDYSQIELRILAHIADVESLIQAFKEDKDIHTITASKIFDQKENMVTSSMRRVAKAVNFGIIYGISSFGLSENVGISPKEAANFIENYFNNYPGIKKHMDDTISKAHIDGYVKTLFNRKRNIDELKNKNYMIRTSGERMALNTPIQGTSADIIKMAMIKVDKLFKEQGIKSKMIVQVHDELVFDVLETEKEAVIKIVKECMENICSLKVPLKAEVNYGKNWYQAK